MAAPTFYNKGDQAIYNSGMSFVPQEKYRLGYTAPTVEEQKIEQTFGIPATNAFTNSGGGGSGGNAFGYGSPVSEVNVRTFNPQSNDPTGSVANAQGIYNQSAQALESGYSPSYTDGSMAGKSLSEIQSMANNQIMDNKEQYGAQGQYTSPYDDTVDQSKYTKTIGSFPSQGFFNRMRNKGFNLMENIPYIGLPTRIIRSILPEQEDNGPGGGTYGIAGLSDAQKEQYNALARIEGGGLFQGQGGMKTLTGKNFNAKGYMEGQMELAKGFNFDTMTDEEIAAEIAKTKANPRQQFKYKQMLEASQMYKTDKIQQEKQRAASAENRASTAAIQGRVDRQYQDQMTRDGKDFSVSGPDTSSNPKGKSNQASSERGYQMHGADGGRVGYFFGGRVNFKNGGLASIL